DSHDELLVDLDRVVDGRCHGRPAGRTTALEFADRPHPDRIPRAGEAHSVAPGTGASGPSGCDWPRDLSPLREPVGAAVRDASPAHGYGLAVWLARRLDVCTDRVGCRALVRLLRKWVLLLGTASSYDRHP